MSHLIRTMRPEDAEYFARNVFNRTVNGGRVQIENLEWFSQGLREWELTKRNLHQSPEVDVYLDELDIEKVYVTPKGQTTPRFMAENVLPESMRGMCLYQYRRICEAAKAADKNFRMQLASDTDFTRLKLEYQAALASTKGKHSLRQLEIFSERLKRHRERWNTPSVEASDRPAPSETSASLPKRGRGRPRKQSGQESLESTIPDKRPQVVATEFPKSAPSLTKRTREERLKSITPEVLLPIVI